MLAVPDHVVLGAEIAGFPEKISFPATNPYPEPLTLLTAVAATTSQLALVSSTLLSPLRPAVLLAKTAATLDVLSGGRLILGVAAGWHQAEFDASGVPLAGRGARMDDTMRACRALWENAPATFSSDTVSFENIHCEPRPLQPGSPRIWVGGGNIDRTARRLTDYADGWIVHPSVAPPVIAEGVERIREAMRSAGRHETRLDVKCALPTDEPEIERALEAEVPPRLAAGVTVIQVQVGDYVSSAAEVPPFLERLARAFEQYRNYPS